MFQIRTLIVDDLPDIRDTLARILLAAHYQVFKASSVEEALAILETNHIHVAILDVRLDESDEDNQDGLDLMYQIRALDPTIAIIMLTAYAKVKMVQSALQPDKAGSSPAFDFLEKDTDSFAQLPTTVRRAFDQKLGINLDLEIDNEQNFLPLLAKRIRFFKTSKPSAEMLLEEVNEILRKMFNDCDRVELESLKDGYSRAVVFRATPWYGETRGEVRIAKIGQYEFIDDEASRYQQYVYGRVGGHRLPQALEFVRTRHLAGILYTFAGLGTPRDFAAFYESAESDVIDQVIDNLFSDTCLNWHGIAKESQATTNLNELFLSLLRLDIEMLQRNLDHTMGGRHPFRKDSDPKWLLFKESIPLLNPVEFIRSAELNEVYQESIIHGDLHAHNVLVDYHPETWLIDFGNTGVGPVMQDYVAFETYLRIGMMPCNDLQTLYEWEKTLASAALGHDIELPPQVKEVSSVAKAHRAILQLRRLAATKQGAYNEKIYLVGLMFTALRLLTLLFLAPVQRDHALISASLIAQRLQTLEEGS